MIVGVSGGPDSVALLSLLLSCRDELNLTLTVAHLDHGLRPESADDAAWVSEQCAAWHVPCLVKRLDEPDALTDDRSGLEERARRARHEFLEQVAIDEGATVIALAHTRDDQAETVLHHIVRGTGLGGLCGIPERRATPRGLEIVRPLLTVSRAAVIDYLAEKNIPPRIDPSNEDRRFTRNRIRHDVLPYLREQLNPQADDALVRLADQAAEVQQYLDESAAHLLSQVLTDSTPDSVRIHCRPLARQARVIVRESFVRLWTAQEWPRQAMTSAHWNGLATLSRSDETTGGLSLPGAIQATRRGDLLVLQRAPATSTR